MGIAATSAVVTSPATSDAPPPLQLVAIAVVAVATLVGLATFTAGATRIVQVLRLGTADRTRTGRPWHRVENTVVEVVGHTRMLQWSIPGAAHWFVMVGFVTLLGTLVTAYGQVFEPHYALPLIGRAPAYAWFVEIIAWLTLLGIVALTVVRQVSRRLPGRSSRFFGSTTWQAYYVEATILAIALCILTLRGLEYGVDAAEGSPFASFTYYPLTAWLGEIFAGSDLATLDAAIIAVATLKIAVSMAWFVVVGLNLSMGVAWHRFTAPFNILFKRDPAGGTSLGALSPMRVAGKPVDFEALEDLPDEASLGVGTITDLSWKGLLDLTTCTECGRCQSQCPAWQTDKPLSPKLLITALRDHAYQVAPALIAAGSDTPDGVTGAGDYQPRALVGATRSGYGAGPTVTTGLAVGSAAAVAHQDVLAVAESLGGVIDPDVLWSCTTCGACVEQCPVDIEHVDHIVDMRRHQVLLESAFPTQLGGLFKNLDGKGNPWGMSARARLEWAKDLPFEVTVVGQDESATDTLAEVDYLLWVGCAGAYDDRAKKTTRAVAELLYAAGVSFAVLGDGETCTGDPARRAGNEFLFQQLANANVETLRGAGARHVVVTCAHCFNTLSNEYPQLGLELEVVHHTQLLNRLVRNGRLVPVAPVGAEADQLRTVTYHDPCYLGRHNGVYSPPRELIEASGVTLKEMPRTRERSFCCGAGGARMWMEETIGTRINANRTEEALATGADAVAIACPFCRVMLADGVASAQATGAAPENFDVVDISQLLLAAVRRGQGAGNSDGHGYADSSGNPGGSDSHDDSDSRSAPTPTTAG